MNIRYYDQRNYNVDLRISIRYQKNVIIKVIEKSNFHIYEILSNIWSLYDFQIKQYVKIFEFQNSF